MKKVSSWILIVVIFIFSISLLYFLKSKNTYPISKYFPLNENDKYIYMHHEGIEDGIVTITVKNVNKVDKGKQFDFLWQGKYNDRIQTLILTSEGIIFHKNKHLAGEIPLKVIRTFSPPLLMIPSELKKKISLSTVQSIYDFEGNLLEKEKIEADISFVGSEDVSVEAGKFKCLYFFIRHNYKDALGNSKNMHTYNFWIAPNIGIVKFIHTFIPFVHMEYIRPEEKDIMNRYSSSFVAVYELKKAIIGTKIIGQ